ncbi:alpha/beta fold hydrolase [Paracraurococcus lichenis]|uniref:Esterase n=1 Tax=Paracraurococcus lichenis TaxID=3064888 RepID=A0ABT9E2V8_9PROT|nr:alpha/beta fold hydrolase [Paracraurococcus sp. LOR1-02]MDO9710499.1 esterase [Paracraurococcus sp. LOR1-02]
MLRRRLLAAPLAAAPGLAPVLAQGAGEPPIALRAMGSFHIGGREAVVTGRPVKEVALVPGSVPARIDPNGTYQVEAMYVQYHLPAAPRGAVPLLLWHGGGLTGVTWESTPDGREGWQQYFLRWGWATYVSDAVERGRAGWAMSPEIFQGDPVFLTKQDPWERFRIGAGPGSWRTRTALPGTQFPIDAYDAFMRQVVPRWTTTDAAQLAAYRALLRQVGPAVVLAHSQGGLFACRAAQAEPAQVRALVLLEPSGFGEATPEALGALRGIPVLALYGDFIDQDARWPAIRQRGLDFYEKLRAAGGAVEVVSLPERGLRGNSHMMMMDRNNQAVAQVVQDWLAARGLWQ